MEGEEEEEGEDPDPLQLPAPLKWLYEDDACEGKCCPEREKEDEARESGGRSSTMPVPFPFAFPFVLYPALALDDTVGVMLFELLPLCVPRGASLYPLK